MLLDISANRKISKDAKIVSNEYFAWRCVIKLCNDTIACIIIVKRTVPCHEKKKNNRKHIYLYIILKAF